MVKYVLFVDSIHLTNLIFMRCALFAAGKMTLYSATTLIMKVEQTK